MLREPRMKAFLKLSALLSLALAACVSSPPQGPAAVSLSDSQAALTADGARLCDRVRKKYVFLAGKESAWDEACAGAPAKAANTSTSSEELRVLEDLLDVLYDPHASLNTNSGESPRLVPSGNDYWIEDGRVTGVRPGSGAALAGLKVGDEVTAMNGQPLDAAIAERVRPAGVTPTDRQLAWAANAAAAGYRGRPHSVTVMHEGQAVTLPLGVAPEPALYVPVTAEMLPGQIGYIRFNNSLGDSDTVAAFDAAMDRLRGARGWILDLRDTPGGGSTDIAEPIMGHFIDAKAPYQLIRPKDKPAWMKTVSPHGGWTAQGPLAVLAGRWTGSMGEGMAVGFDGLRRGDVFGNAMAGLAGGVEDFPLNRSGLRVRFPTYDLAHVNGTPRYKWLPPHLVTADNGTGPDLARDAAIAWINSHEG
jgi:carboxyl-terminal processing protease